MISIHDVAPSTIAEAGEWRALVAEAVEGPASLLLVPRYRGRDSWRAGPARAWARERASRGDEIVLHGWSHTRADGRDGAELAGRRPAQVAALIRDGAGRAARGRAVPRGLHRSVLRPAGGSGRPVPPGGPGVVGHPGLAGLGRGPTPPAEPRPRRLRPGAARPVARRRAGRRRGTRPGAGRPARPPPGGPAPPAGWDGGAGPPRAPARPGAPAGHARRARGAALTAAPASRAARCASAAAPARETPDAR